MAVGVVKEFDVKNGNWSAYVDRLEMYFVANRIADNLKLPTLIAMIGDEVYELLSTLANPRKPSNLTYTEAVTLLQAHLQPKPSVLAERYRFRRRRQLPGENISDFIADLKKLSRNCEFNGNLEENLRDQLVCGLRSEIIRQKLFAENDIAYNKLLTLATTLEGIERDSRTVQDSREKPQEYNANKLGVGKCTICGSSGHRETTCKFKYVECTYCGKVGHPYWVCTKKEADKDSGPSNTTQASNRGRGISRGGYQNRGAPSRTFGAPNRQRYFEPANLSDNPTEEQVESDHTLSNVD